MTVYGTLVVTTTSLPVGTLGVDYGAETLAAAGGDETYSWALVLGSGSLPTGLSLSLNGDISGAPTVKETQSFTVEVTSGDGQTARQALSITVIATLAVTTTELPRPRHTFAYSETLAAAGGDGTYSWALVSGSLPTGLTLAADGEISGTATQVVGKTFTVEVRSGDGQTAQRALSIAVQVVILTSELPDAVANVPYFETLLTTRGGTWSLVAGSMPPGMGLWCQPAGCLRGNGNGNVGGTPAEVGTHTFTVQVTSGDATSGGPHVAQAELTLKVIAPPDPVLQPHELCSAHTGDAIPTFEDTALNNHVHLKFRDAAAYVTCARLAELTTLEPFLWIYLTSLVGMQNFTGLTELSLFAGYASDIGPLAGLTKLTSLTLRGDSISDIGVLSGLTNLTELQVRGVFQDISALSGLTGLTRLSIQSEAITDITQLSGLTKLTRLSVSGASITDISPLGGLSGLTGLWISRTSVSDIGPLRTLPGLTSLDLQSNSITDISPLAGLTSLTNFYLNDNSITDVGALSGLTSLERLDLEYNRDLSNIQPLLDNPGLGAGDSVRLSSTKVSCTDVAALQAKGVTVWSDCS